jgi:Periplasmic copper-binding protein (NosD)
MRLFLVVLLTVGCGGNSESESKCEADCANPTPVCDEAMCRGCEGHDECVSAVCELGSCVDETLVTYVSPTGGPTDPCTQTAPCDLATAIGLMPPRPLIVLFAGTHVLAESLTIDGVRALLGIGEERSVITVAGLGPIIKLAPGADVRLEHVELSGARSTAVQAADGVAVFCPDGNVRFRMNDALVANNESAGVDGHTCRIRIETTTFVSSGVAVRTVGSTMNLYGSAVNIQRCTFVGNATAMFLHTGGFTIANNFIVRNQEGIDMFSDNSRIVEYNTIVDNSVFGLRCEATSPRMYRNNLLARNAVNTAPSNNCSYEYSLIVVGDIGPIKFKSPDVAPFDYHITEGSSAQGGARNRYEEAYVGTDFDGESRDNNPDVGADEIVGP